MAKFRLTGDQVFITNMNDQTIELTEDEALEFYRWFDEILEVRAKEREYDLFGEFTYSGFRDTFCMTCGEGMSAAKIWPKMSPL